MSLIFLVLCSLILFNGVFAVGPNIRQKLSLGELQQLIKREDGSHLHAVNEDFLYPMFDDLKLEEMLQYVHKPQIFDFVKNTIFPVKYQNYEFGIIGATAEIPITYSVVRTKTVFMFGVLYLSAFKYFGESIHNVVFHNSYLISDHRSAQLYQYINEYCSDSLTSFTPGVVKRNTWMDFKKPFSKLKYLYIIFEMNEVETIRKLDEFFPKLKQLSFRFSPAEVDNTDGNVDKIVDSPHMATLEDLIVSNYIKNETVHANALRQLENFFENNQQIRGFSYLGDLGQILEVISKKLPNLEKLLIQTIGPKTPPAQFDYVKHLIVYSKAEGPFKMLSFPRLESLNMVYSQMNDSSWETFLKNHQNIRKLNCTISHSNDGISGLEDLLTELPSINELGISYNGGYDINLISRLIESHTHLVKFHHKISSTHNLVRPALAPYKEQFGSKWMISLRVEDSSSILLFKRKI